MSVGASGARVEAVTLDPWLLARSPGVARVPFVPNGNAGGLTLPGLVWYSTDRAPAGTLEHELGHVRQVQALGAPAQLVAHLLTGGRAFEDYLGGELWHPPPWAGRARCPLLTFAPPSGGVVLWACSP